MGISLSRSPTTWQFGSGGSEGPMGPRGLDLFEMLRLFLLHSTLHPSSCHAAVLQSFPAAFASLFLTAAARMAQGFQHSTLQPSCDSPAALLCIFCNSFSPM